MPELPEKHDRQIFGSILGQAVCTLWDLGKAVSQKISLPVFF